MEAGRKMLNGIESNGKVFFICCISILLCGSSVEGLSRPSENAICFSTKPELSVLNEIRIQLSDQKNPLHINYPGEINRLYLQAGDKLLWLAPDTVKMHAGDAMMILDCVLQYGLSHRDYHPQELLYDKLNLYTSKFSKIPFAKKARFDILLTDAMLTLMNNLHYGKLNPEHTAEQIDASGFTGFRANNTLMSALKSGDFTGVVTGVQPKSKMYLNLQYRMHLLEGRYTAECYTVPESDIRKMAINMERLRWVSTDNPVYMLVNIPAATLNLITPETSYQFKVVVGKPSSPTPVQRGFVDFFTLAQPGPSWAFESNKAMKISIRGGAYKQLFNKKQRSLSMGSILVEQPAKLAGLLLKQDNAMVLAFEMNNAIANHKTKKINLKNPVPVIITYLTCEVKEGVMITYRDIYKQDKNLEMALYGIKQPLIINNKINL